MLTLGGNLQTFAILSSLKIPCTLSSVMFYIHSKYIMFKRLDLGHKGHQGPGIYA